MAESYRLWLQYETRTDDITVIVVHVNGLTDVRELVYIDFSLVPLIFFFRTSVVSFHQTPGQSATPGPVLQSPVPQVVEVTGSESRSAKNQCTRHDLSRARLRVIESSLEKGKVWVPPSPANRKTWEEEVNSISYVVCFIFFI